MEDDEVGEVGEVDEVDEVVAKSACTVDLEVDGSTCAVDDGIDDEVVDESTDVVD